MRNDPWEPMQHFGENNLRNMQPHGKSICPHTIRLGDPRYLGMRNMKLRTTGKDFK
jgi:hypothetical protein